MGKLLDAKGLINQSTLRLSGQAIEIAIVGYGFIFSFAHHQDTESPYLRVSLDRYFNQMDREITFDVEPSNDGQDAPRTHYSSYLSGTI